MPRNRARGALAPALALAALVLATDQITKWIVLQEWAGLPLRAAAWMRLDITYNSGISFSQLRDTGSLVVVLVAAVVGGVTIALFLAPPRYRPALGVILGGALGNLVDRLRYDGAVLDFVGVSRYPSFNVADVAIFIGTAWLVVQMIRGIRA